MIVVKQCVFMACRRAHQQPDVEALAMCSPGIELGLCRRQARPVRGEHSKFESVLLGQMVMRPSKRLLYTSTAVHANEIRVAKSHTALPGGHLRIHLRFST